MGPRHSGAPEQRISLSVKDACLEKILQQPRAKEAFRALVKDNFSQSSLEHWLRYVASLSRPNRKQESIAIKRRRLQKLVSQCTDLAHSIQTAKWEIQYDPTLWYNLPRLLHEFADNLTSTNFGLLSNRTVDPRIGATENLIYRVKESTGREHYREISDLLNSIEYASGRTQGKSVRWNPEQIKQLIYRNRKAVQALVADHIKPVPKSR